MAPTFVSFMLVGVGGAAGAMTRFAMTLLFAHKVAYLPLATFASNVLGCFIMGIVMQLFASADWFGQSGIVSDQNRLLFAIGFCGSLTTLSSMIVELNTLMQRNELLAAFGYLFATFLGGFACFYAGVLLVKSLVQVPGN